MHSVSMDALITRGTAIAVGRASRVHLRDVNLPPIKAFNKFSNRKSMQPFWIEIQRLEHI